MSDNSPFFSVPISDAYMYHTMAVSISQGNIFSDEAFYQSPLFPYLLGAVYYLFDPDPWTIRIIHAAMGIANIVLVFFVARFVTTQTWAAVASLLSALYFGYVFHESFLLLETVGLHLLLWSLYFTLLANSKRRLSIWFIAGAFIGLTALTRSNALILLPLLSAWLLWTGRHQLKKYTLFICALLLGAAITISPATLHNLKVSDEFVLLTNNGGATFMFGNNPHARGNMVLPSGFTGNIINQRQEEIAVAEQYTNQKLTHKEAADYWIRKSLQFLIENPGFALQLEYFKLRRLLANDEYGSNYIIKYESNPYKWLMPLPYAVILGLSIVGLTRINWKSDSIHIYFIFALMTVATIMIFFMTARYRLPLVPLLIIFAAIGMQAIFESIKERNGFNLLLAVGIFGFVSYFSFLPLEREDHQAAQWLREGIAWMRQDELDLALERFELAQNHNPEEQGIWLNSGLLYLKMLDFEKALIAADKALTTELGPDRMRALALKGVVLMNLQQYDEAEAALSVAASELPYESLVQHALIELYITTGQTHLAHEQIIRAEASNVSVPDRIKAALGRLEQN